MATNLKALSSRASDIKETAERAEPSRRKKRKQSFSGLVIVDSVGIEFLWQLSSASPRDQPEDSAFSPLRGLEKLRLRRLPNLVDLFYGESEPSYLLPAGTFSSLRELWISGCDNMKQLFTVQSLQSLQNLETLDVDDCEGLEEIAADGNGVGRGGGEGTQLTSSEGATANVILPKLRWLHLENLPQLKNICKAAMICHSIKEIKIFNCPNLKRLPSFLSNIDGPPYLLPAGTFSSLKNLNISGCHDMKQLFTVQLLQSLQNLETLDVDDCEGLEEIAADGNGVGQGGGEGTQLTSSEGATANVILPKLWWLHLENLPQLKNICKAAIQLTSSEATANIILPKLRWLYLNGLPQLKSICKAAMICESIEEIKIFGCPNLKRLPLFLSTIDGPPYLLPAGTFSSLKNLNISGCHDMKQLFTVQLLQSLQNLEVLCVKYCEGLEEIAADGNGVGQGGGEGTQLTSSEGATANVILPKLWRLRLENLPQLKSICKAAMINESIEHIAIFNCPNLKRLPSFLSNIDGPSYLLPTGTFSSLKNLNISGCHDMKQLFTVQLLQSLQNLEVLCVKNCEGLEEIAADGNGVGQGGGEGTQLTSSEGATAVILPKLRRLILDNLPQLKSICKAAMICDSIEEIVIFNCPNLKRLPLFLSTIDGPPSLPSTLHKIRGDKEWWESLEWDNPSAKNDLDPLFSTLRWDNWRPLVCSKS